MIIKRFPRQQRARGKSLFWYKGLLSAVFISFCAVSVSNARIRLAGYRNYNRPGTKLLIHISSSSTRNQSEITII